MTTINANAGTGLTETVDATGILTLQTANTTAVIIGTDQNANFTSTGAITLPNGTTAQRPSGANVANGMLRYNTTGNNFEAYLNNGWATVTNATAYTVSYLIVAGGGSGGYNCGAGGGAGGYLTGNVTVNRSTVYSFVIGAGASAATSTDGTRGSNSTAFSLTAVGGGGGAQYAGTPTSGGSGGGGAAGTTGAGGSATSGQGFAGGSGGAGNQGGGGGGATAVGGSPPTSSSPGGNGGAGIANPITGSTAGQNVGGTYYVSGGGGGACYLYANSSGGNGGGGYGGSGIVGTAGTANTGGGGGGGGGGSNTTSGAGGSGVIVISIPTINYTGTYTGSPAVTTSGSNTILTYTGSSGSYTA